MIACPHSNNPLHHLSDSSAVTVCTVRTGPEPRGAAAGEAAGASVMGPGWGGPSEGSAGGAAAEGYNQRDSQVIRMHARLCHLQPEFQHIPMKTG